MIYYISNTPYFENSSNLSVAAQKFNKLFMKGFNDNGLSIISLGHFSEEYKEEYSEKKTSIKFVTLKETKGIFKYFNRFRQVRSYLKNRDIDKAKDILVYDCLNGVSVYAALTMSNNFHKTLGIITDLPEFMIDKNNSIRKKIINKLYSILIKKIYNKTAFFVLLSKKMCDKVKVKNKDYFVLDGFVDEETYKLEPKKTYNRKIMYAGSLDKKYGILNLVEAVINSNGFFKLYIYGRGDIENQLSEIARKYSNINYFGQKTYKECRDLLFEADILINPRCTDYDFTRYSFPSKNIEYMSTGIPFASTNLHGMEKYKDYITIIDDESPNGILKALNIIDDKYCEKKVMACELREILFKANTPKIIVKEILEKLQ